MTEAEYLETKLRGTGRTTNLIKNSPKKCWFIAANETTANICQKIANKIGRSDVSVTTPNDIFGYILGRSSVSDIVFDHFLDLHEEHWDKLYQLRDKVRRLYKGNEMSKLEKLKKDLLLIEDSIDSSVCWSEYEILVGKYAPGFKVGLKGLQKAKEEIERLIEAEENAMTSFQRAKEEYEKYGANGFANDYIARLEKCRPWALRCPVTGDLFNHAPGRHITPILFPSKETAERYANLFQSGKDYWEIVQWEGSNE